MFPAKQVLDGAAGMIQKAFEDCQNELEQSQNSNDECNANNL